MRGRKNNMDELLQRGLTHVLPKEARRAAMYTDLLPLLCAYCRVYIQVENLGTKMNVRVQIERFVGVRIPNRVSGLRVNEVVKYMLVSFIGLPR